MIEDRTADRPSSRWSVLWHLAKGSHPAHSLKNIVQNAGWSGTAQGLGLLLRFVFVVTVARRFGALSLGLYALSMSIGTAAALVARLGLDQAVLRFMSQYRARGETEEARGLFIFTSSLVAVLGVLTALAVYLTGGPLGEAIGDIRYRDAAEAIAWAVPMIALAQVWQFGLRGTHRFRTAAVLEHVAVPALSLGGLFAWSFATTETNVPVVSVTVAYWIVGSVSGAVLMKRVGTRGASSGSKRRWLSFAAPLSIESGLTALVPVGVHALIGTTLGPSALGHFVPAASAAALVTLPLIAVNSIVAPTAAALDATGDRTQVQHIYGRSTTLTALAGLVAAVALWTFGKPVLGIFGADFRAAYGPLVILVAGQLVNASAGPSGQLLAMMGRPWWRLVNAALLLLLAVGAAAVLVPSWGLAGAASAMSISLAMVNIAQVVEVRRGMGLWPYTSDSLSPWRWGRE